MEEQKELGNRLKAADENIKKAQLYLLMDKLVQAGLPAHEICIDKYGQMYCENSATVLTEEMNVIIKQHFDSIFNNFDELFKNNL